MDEHEFWVRFCEKLDDREPALVAELTGHFREPLVAFRQELHDYFQAISKAPLPDHWRADLDRFLNLPRGVIMRPPQQRFCAWLVECDAREHGRLPGGPVPGYAEWRRQLGPAGLQVNYAKPAPDRPFIIHVRPNISGPPSQSRKAQPQKIEVTRPKSVPAVKKLDAVRAPRGKWTDGPVGNGFRELETPIRLDNGEVIKRVPYRNGMPVYDQWQYRIGGKPVDVIIAITGDPVFDREQARKAWEATYKGEKLPKKYIFHHDGQMTEVVTHDGKKIFVGRMQPVPIRLNEAAHIGSAKAAKALNLDKKIAAEVNKLAREGKGPLKAIDKRLRSLLAKGIKKAGRLVPIVGGALAILDFAENAEAHGVGGALVRATPVLSDLIGAYELGSDFADQIKSQAKENLEQAYRETNRPVQSAHKAAQSDTATALNSIAEWLPVEDAYLRGDALIEAIKEPLTEFYATAFDLNLRVFRGERIEYPIGAKPKTMASETPFETRLLNAKKKLERDLRQKLETRQPATHRGPLS